MATKTRLTLDEFLAIPDFDERRLELIDGEVCEKPMPRWVHGVVAGELYHLMRDFGYGAVEPRALIPATGNRAASSPLPDFAFYAASSPPPHDWMTTPPTVVAEVLSPGQSLREMRAKVDAYLAFGVGSVWVFDTEQRTVDVYEGNSRRTLQEETPLTSSAVPGLSIDLRALFARAHP